MTHYDYNKFTHPVPPGYSIPKGTPTRNVNSDVETFFTTKYDLPVTASDAVEYYLDYDITKPELPEEINSVIYNVRAGRSVYPVAVYQGDMLWAVFSALGKLTALYSSEIKSFDTTPPKGEAGGGDD